MTLTRTRKGFEDHDPSTEAQIASERSRYTEVGDRAGLNLKCARRLIEMDQTVTRTLMMASSKSL
jgi:hypothetical protein